MKILICGNMGYIGPILVQHLKKKNFTLYGFDTGFFASCLMDTTFLPEVYLKKQYFGDVRHLPDEIFDGMDAVVYLSAISNDPMGKAFEKVTGDINAECAILAATKAKKAGVKNFVFASSCSMYGYAEGGARTEKDELNPLTAYARSKVAAEKGLQPLADNNFTITCLRFATACGFSPRIRLDLVLNDFVAGAITSGKIEILSDGTPWRPLIHVKDMSRAIEWASTRSSDNGGEYLAVNAGSNEWNYQVKELAEAVAKVIPNTTVTVNPDAAPDKRSYKVSFDLFKSLAPDYTPQVSLEQAVKDIAEGLEKAKFSDANFRESEYIRLVKLNRLKEAGLLNENLEWI
ncbi:MAG: NAD(P)-dependent oxidoreductase [Candidatus Hydrogenedentota bacterium]|nr:MAG: NAD(P)-dependent oxidoreductase [Candidatus Hydrogenedentota bacterium]